MREIKTGSASGLKAALFQLMALCLHHNIINGPIYLLMLLFEYYQMLPYIYAATLLVSKGVKEALDLHGNTADVLFDITLNSVILEASINVLLGILFALLGLFLLLAAALVYLRNLKPDYKALTRLSQQFGWAFKVLALLLRLLCVDGTMVFFVAFLLPFNCEKSGEESVLVSDKGTTCWKGAHIAAFTASIIDIILYAVLLAILELLMYENNPKSSLPWASCGTNKGVAVKHISKLVLVAFHIFDSDSDLYHYLFISQIVLQGFIVYWLYLSPPFINQLINYFTIFEHCSLFLMFLFGYSIRLKGDVLNHASVVLVVVSYVLIPLVGIFIKDLRDRRVLNSQITDEKEISDKEYYFYILFYYLEQYAQGSSAATILLNGLYSNHQLNCRNARCRCVGNALNSYLASVADKRLDDRELKDALKLQGSAEVEKEKLKKWESLSVLFQILTTRIGLYDALEEGIGEVSKERSNVEEAMPLSNYEMILGMVHSIIDKEVEDNITSASLRMISSYSAKEYAGNVFKAIYDLLYIEEKLKPSLSESFLVFISKRDINEEIAIFSQKKAGSNALNVESLMIFEAHYKNFRGHAQMGSNYTNRFWELMKNKDIDVNALYDIGSKLGEIYAAMKKSYSVATEIYPQNFKLVKEFGDYERYVMNNEGLAAEFDEEAKRIRMDQAEHANETENNEMQIIRSGNHTCVCLVSGSPGSLGDILAMNDELQHNLGFRAKEVIGQNCTVLCPGFIAAKHNAMIEGFIRRGTSSFVGALHIVPACSSKGFVVPMEIIIKILPSIDRGLSFVTILKRFEKYSLWFPTLYIPYSSDSFAMIVTNPEGQLLGITENCMLRLGIPISLFKGKSSDDTVTITAIAKELRQEKVLEEVRGKGRRVEIDTKPFMYSINRENLPVRESRYLEENAGKTVVFMRLFVENYVEGLTLHHYRMVILPNAESLCEEPQPIVDLKVPEYNEDDDETEMQRGSNAVQDNDLDADADTQRELLQGKGLHDLKQTVNSRSSHFKTATVNKWVHSMLLAIVAMTTAQFVLMVVERNRYANYAEILWMANMRLTFTGLISAEVFGNKLMASSATSNGYTLYDGQLVIFDYLKEYALRNIKELNSVVTWMKKIDFPFNDALTALERLASVSIASQGRFNNINVLLHTLSTAITQYTAKASDIMSYDIDGYRDLLSDETTTINSLSSYFFIVRNGLEPLPQTVQKAINEYTGVMKDKIGKYLKIYIIIVVVIAISVVVCFGVIVPKLVGVQGEKVCILLLYTQMNKNEINRQIGRCVEYQKVAGYFDAEEESRRNLMSQDSLEQSEEAKGREENAPRLQRDHVSDDEKSDESIDENEKTIYSIVDTDKLNAKLKNNKLWLIIASVAISTMFASLPFTFTIYSWNKNNEVKEMFDITNGITQLLRFPLYLTLYALIGSDSYNEDTGKNFIELEVRPHIQSYLDNYMGASAFTQTMRSLSRRYLSNLKSTFLLLDSSDFCSELLEMYREIRHYYGAESSGLGTQLLMREQWCASHDSSRLNRGLTQTLYHVYQTFSRIDSSHIANYALSNTAMDCLNVTTIYLAPTIEGLLIILKRDVEGSLRAFLVFLIAFYVCYIVVSSAIHFIFWACFFRAVRKETIRSRGMLKLMPMELIKKLKVMKPSGDNQAINESLNFFKQLHKKRTT